ncbi:nuclear protein SET [Nitzschia inconspicua]|uniref:Nuclear protein SET n=1 Tax=Nitzschia inconspicua TaxID=303405 RepID=A0A9K3LSZ6_9STRA|nr:nuclear protein SET [Nitzschia inconspicua]
MLRLPVLWKSPQTLTSVRTRGVSGYFQSSPVNPVHCLGIHPSRIEHNSTSPLCRYTTSHNRSHDDNEFREEQLFSDEKIHAFNTSKNTNSLVVIDKDTTDSNKGWTLYTKADIAKGQRILRGRALKIYHDDASDKNCKENSATDQQQDESMTSRRGSHTIQTGWTTHVVMDLPAILINHSCHANVGIRENNMGAYDFIALGDLQMGEEVLWDYETSEYYIHGQFQCSCGAPNCRGTLKGFHANGKEVMQLYGKDFIAPYLFTKSSQR